MNHFLKLLLAPATAIWLGSCLTLFFGLKLEPGFSDELKRHIISLLTIFGTISAAYIALQGPLAQISEDKRRAEEARRRDQITARSFLPLALSDLNSISEYILRIAPYDDTYFSNPRAFETHEEEIALSDKNHELISNALKHASKNEAATLKGILLQYQITRSRVDDLFKKPKEKFILRSVVLSYDAIKLSGYVAHLYALCRSTADDLPDFFNPEYFRLPYDLNLTSSDLEYLVNFHSELREKAKRQSVIDFIESSYNR